MFDEDSFSSLFAPENFDPSFALDQTPAPPPCWKVLLVDDEPDIHTVLHLALSEIEVEGHRLELFDADSAEAGRRIMEEHPEIALMLVDVVMESEEAGLKLVRAVRDELNNHLTQIVVLTGQPGYAPQREVVAGYAIDGYRLKSELTADKIFVTVYAALRTHQALCELHQHRQAAESLARSLREREERLRAVVETAPDAIILSDNRGTIIGWNEGAEKLFGFCDQEMLGNSILKLVPPSHRVQMIDLIAELEKGNATKLTSGHPFEAEALKKNGTLVPVELVIGSWQSGEERAYSAIVRNLTERRAAEANLRLAASVYANSYEGIVITDANRIVIDVNPAYQRITGFSAEELLGRPSRLISSQHFDPMQYSLMQRSLREMDFWQGEVESCRHDGGLINELLSISVVRDPKGELTHYIEVSSDISHLKEHERELVRVANYDTLTSLPNRRLLSDRLLQAMARSRRNGTAVAVCYLDLDGFKRVNDDHGHATGDRLLVEIANRLKTVLREDDTLARIGGDEFVFLLTGLCNIDGCTPVLDRVLDEISHPILIDGRRINISASIGITLFPADESNAETLLRHADQAMYQAKESGKNGYHLFDAEHDREQRSHRLQIERIVQALADGEMLLYYQPKVDLTDGRVVGAEALIRWMHPERGLLEPADFLRYIEGNDLEVTVGEWVLEEVMRQITIWKAAGLKLTVSANISANHLLEANFADRLEHMLSNHPAVTPGLLELEILETTGLNDMKAAVQTLGQCRKLGVQISLDDFGTGYSSLTYFLKLPVQSLKVDQSFVRGMLDDPNELGMVEGVIRLAQAFNRPVIAEGVETLNHGSMLLSLNCHLAQGYGVAHPMPACEFPQWVEKWQSSHRWLALAKSAEDGDLVLSVARQCHTRWLEELVHCYRHPEESSETSLDSASCPFGRWYDGSGFARYGSAARYAELGRQHEQAHQLALELLSSAPGSQRAAMLLDSLYTNSQHLLGTLEGLGAGIR